MNSEVRKFVRTFDHIDGVEVRAGGKHLSVYLNGNFVTSISRTPSDPRWRDNAAADLRRAGITPATRPMKPPQEIKELMPVDEIRARIAALENLNEFARFVTDDIPTIFPKLRTFKNFHSAAATLSGFRTRKTQGLSEWSHLLLDQAIRTWDSMQGRGNGKAVPPVEPEVVDEDEGTSIYDADGVDLADEPVTASSRQDEYLNALFDVLRRDGFRVPEHILERIDKLTGVAS